ncbi:hypothetical protein Tco_0121670 [Tanacetum coccineum]
MLAPSGGGLILTKPLVLDQAFVYIAIDCQGNILCERDTIEVPYDNRNNTPTEQEAANIMQALKESQKTSRRKPGTGGSNEGTGSKPGVLDEFIVVYATSSEGTDIKLGVSDEEKDIKEEMDDKDGNVDDEGDDHISDTQDANDEDVKIESNEYDIYKYKIRVRKVSIVKDSADTDAPTFNLEQGSEKSASEILQIKREQAEKQHKPKFTIKSTNKAALEEYDLKSALYQSVHANKSFNRNPTNHRLYHALMEALIEDENTMDKGVTDTVKDHKRKHDDDEDDDDEDPLAGLNQVTRKGTSEVLFLRTPRPPTPDPEWNISVRLYLINQHSLGLIKWSLHKGYLGTPIGLLLVRSLALSSIKLSTTSRVLMHEYLKTSDLEVLRKLPKGYGHVEEIMVKRSDQQLYKFKEGDFVDLHLNDIEDMLLLVVQHKLFHLDGSVFSTRLLSGLQHKDANEKVDSCCPMRSDALVMGTASTAAKPYQGDSSEFYLITGSGGKAGGGGAVERWWSSPAVVLEQSSGGGVAGIWK